MINLSLESENDGTLQSIAPDLTPMLDILFILLVFFMLTAGVVLKSLDVTLPSAVDEAIPTVESAKHIVLEIDQKGYRLDGKPYASFESLSADLTARVQAKADQELLIAGDKNAPIEKLLNVLTFLQSKGIVAANILMQQEAN